MSIIFGTSARLGYDYFGVWTRRIDVAVSTPDAVIGDCANPPLMQPGTFAPCGDYKTIKLTVTATQENT